MIGVFNTDAELAKELGRTVDITKTYNAVSSIFIDWIPTKKGTSQERAAALLQQANIIEEGTKAKIPIAIFDRYQALTNDEYKWLKKYNITFFEPSVRTRDGFKYLSFWTKIHTKETIPLDDHIRPIHLGYIGPIADRIKSFDTYYVKAKQLNNDLTVAYHTNKIIEEKASEYTSFDLKPVDFTFKDVQYTIIIGTANDYRNGYLDPYFFKALNDGCIPFITKEHRYFNSLANVISNRNIIDFYFSYEKIYIGLLLDVYDSIVRYYPEMKINYVVETIKNVLGEK